jgi:glycosyltransferase involved in cell wall biosynthesis
MKLLIVTRYYSETSFAGVERFIRSLSEWLINRGDKVKVIWLTSEKYAAIRQKEGVAAIASPPSRFQPIDQSTHDLITTEIKNFLPTAAHFITFGRAEAATAKILTAMGIPYGYLYNSPSCSCRRSDLLYLGEKICDGQINANKCLVCKLNQHGFVPRLLASPIELLIKQRPMQFFNSRLKIHNEIKEYDFAFRKFLYSAAIYLLHAQWPAELLLKNGAMNGRFFFFEQGIAGSGLEFNKLNTERSDKKFRIGYIGRRDQNKGIHIALKAYQSIEDEQSEFLVAGASSIVTPYEKNLMKIVAGDKRVVLLPSLSDTQVGGLLRSLSLLVIPSIWLETGPLVLREAVALGLPVLASGTMGNPALLQYGRLPPVVPNTIHQWRIRLADCITNYNAGKWFVPEPIRQPTEAEMNQKLALVYEDIINGNNSYGSWLN